MQQQLAVRRFSTALYHIRHGSVARRAVHCYACVTVHVFPCSGSLICDRLWCCAGLWGEDDLGGFVVSEKISRPVTLLHCCYIVVTCWLAHEQRMPGGSIIAVYATTYSRCILYSRCISSTCFAGPIHAVCALLL